MKKLLTALTAFALALIPATVGAAPSPAVTSEPEVKPTIVGRTADGALAYLDWAPEGATGYLLVYRVDNGNAEAKAVGANAGYEKVITYEVENHGLDLSKLSIDINVPANVASGQGVRVIHVWDGGLKNDYIGHTTGYVSFHISPGEGLSPFVVLATGSAGNRAGVLPNTDAQ